jgi:hypothetical protein
MVWSDTLILFFVLFLWEDRFGIRKTILQFIVFLSLVQVKTESQRLLGGMRSESLPPDLQNITKLGLMEVSELPSTLTYAKQVRAHKNFQHLVSFSFYLRAETSVLLILTGSILGLFGIPTSLLGATRSAVCLQVC